MNITVLRRHCVVVITSHLKMPQKFGGMLDVAYF